MSETVNLPELGESVTEGTVTRWLKSVGDSVEVDEPLVEVSTDKVDTEIPSPVAGVIEEILVDEDEDIEVGAPLVVIGDGSGSSDGGSDDSADEAEEEEAPAEEAAEETAEAEESQDSGSEESGSEDSGASDSGSDDSGEKTEIKLPELGESVTEGTVTRWLKEVGDSVDVDEPLIEVSTDKVDTEVPSPVAGTLLEIKVEEDEDVEVGQVLAIVGSGSASSSSEAPKEEPKEETKEEAPAEEPTEEPAEESKPEPKEEPKEEAKSEPAPKAESAPAGADKSAAGYVTPIVRKLANDNGVDLNSIEGTGVGGRIRKQDVEAAIEKQKSASASQPAAASAPASSAPAAKAPSNVPSPEALKVRGTTVKAPRIRQVIASRMRESLDISTQLTQVQEVDMTRIVALRKQAKASFQQTHGVNLTYLPFITKAVTHALTQIPAFNASYDEEKQEITYHDAEHIGMAVDTERGLLVPVISDAGDLSLAGVAKKIAEAADKARTNKLSPSDLSGSTFSITNIGSVGALFDTPIINQPNVGILGTGIIEKRPRVVTDEFGNDAIAIRHMMYLSLTYDHRLVDGADAGRFLQTVKAQLENAEFASELGL